MYSGTYYSIYMESDMVFDRISGSSLSHYVRRPITLVRALT